MTLPDWPRPRWTPGGKDPFLFYVVYGAVDTARAFSPDLQRSAGIPPGLDAMAYGPTAHPDVVASFREGYAWDQLRADSPSLAAGVAAEDRCVILKGEIADPPTLNYLRDAIGFLDYCLDGGGIAIYDPQMLKWWEPSAWRSEIWEPGETALHAHVVILASEDASGTEWIHTRGLRKFGRPDLSIHQVTPAHRGAIIDLCNRFIALQVAGEIVNDGQEVRLHSLPAPMRCLRRGNADDPDFNNEHIEIVWESE
jgi:hypothetical protein